MLWNIGLILKKKFHDDDQYSVCGTPRCELTTFKTTVAIQIRGHRDLKLFGDHFICIPNKNIGT